MTQTLDQAAIIETLRNRKALLHELGATALYMFGSRARGDHKPDSDIDLFIDFDRAHKVPRLTGIIGAEHELSVDFGVPVTITTRDALHPLMKAKIMADAIRVL